MKKNSFLVGMSVDFLKMQNVEGEEGGEEEDKGHIPNSKDNETSFSVVPKNKNTMRTRQGPKPLINGL